ncbi:pirin-like C-terminal cupin domain-containing protein [Hymenobacter cellulosivorans]|uniref:Pirin C-terminal domain-containing protein n=1 Tax=Hymenobacter cellulosivorans TaxID=2932249 RepID=A0ABY4F842_9BACT|nr:pirin-like C-terminal cupin domain-containing protein [Hymenobacter cellulosivorans]UOQ52188.1 hypothetical protein MUN80_20800 [Hymenobacter cellulosivorans]
MESITGIEAAIVELAGGGRFTPEVAPGRTVLLYVLRGSATVNSRGVGSRTLVEFDPEGTGIDVHATEDTTLLYCTGQPYHEPLAWQGPYVMNTQTEIMEAMRDYRMGKMGMLFDE